MSTKRTPRIVLLSAAWLALTLDAATASLRLPVITRTSADLEAELLVIEGKHFGSLPVVYLGAAGGAFDQLAVSTADETFIEAHLGSPAPGTYLVVVKSGFLVAAMDVTLGAVGPSGPRGERGDIGPRGNTGPPGEQGEPGPPGEEGPPGPPGIAWRGAWEPATQYAADDAVSHIGSAWIARRSSLDVEPVEGDDWTLVAARGDVGEKGEKGERGDVGPAGSMGLQGDPGPQGDPGEPGPQGPPGIVWREAWDPAAEYAADEAVHHLGSSWIARRSSLDVEPVEGEDWTLVAAKGDAGEKGERGDEGPTGDRGPQGLPGPPGTRGTDGTPGVSCWDLNESLVCDPATEDRDGDGACTPVDCFGAPTGGAGLSAGSIDRFKVDYGGPNALDGWSTLTGGGLTRFGVEALVLRGSLDVPRDDGSVRPLRSDEFTTDALNGKVVAIQIEDLEFLPFQSSDPSTAFFLQGPSHLTLLEVGDGGGYQWFQDNRTGRRYEDIHIIDDTGRLQYTFPGCEPTIWTPGPDVRDRRGDWVPSSTLEVSCGEVDFPEGPRKNLLEWLQQSRSTAQQPLPLGDVFRDVTVTYLNSDGTDGNQLSYQDVLLSRYVFPRFDNRFDRDSAGRSTAPIVSESIVLTPGGLSREIPP